MTKAFKAALWSALVVPGAGHLILKRYLTGLLFVLVSLFALSLIVVEVLKMAKSISSQLTYEPAQTEATSMLGVLAKGFQVLDTQTINIAFAVFLLSWIVGIVDAYRIGDRQDRSLGDR